LVGYEAGVVEERSNFDPITTLTVAETPGVDDDHLLKTSSSPSITRIMPGACPRFVFSCFKRVERWGDRLTGAAGPFFVAIATLLFILGTLCFRMSLFFF